MDYEKIYIFFNVFVLDLLHLSLESVSFLYLFLVFLGVLKKKEIILKNPLLG